MVETTENALLARISELEIKVKRLEHDNEVLRQMGEQAEAHAKELQEQLDLATSSDAAKEHERVLNLLAEAVTHADLSDGALAEAQERLEDEANAIRGMYNEAEERRGQERARKDRLERALNVIERRLSEGQGSNPWNSCAVDLAIVREERAALAREDAKEDDPPKETLGDA